MDISPTTASSPPLQPINSSPVPQASSPLPQPKFPFGLVIVSILGGITLSAFVFFGYQYLKINHQATVSPSPTPVNSPQPNPGTRTVCTMDAKLCPDGSSVGRTGPNCEFSPCPDSTKSSIPSDWKTYTNSQYGYQLKYPVGWTIKETPGSAASQIVSGSQNQMVELTNNPNSIKIFFEGDWDHGFEPWELDKRETVSLGNKSAVKTILASTESKNLWIIYTIENFHDFRIEASTDKTNLNLIDQILSTFEFSGN